MAINSYGLGMMWAHRCLGEAAEAVKVLEITHRDCISWRVKEAKKGMKPGSTFKGQVEREK